jgi:hypothetical protein
MKTKKLPCVECGKPTAPPKGNWNAQRVVICKAKKCRRQRKTALQKERRRQMLINFEASAAKIGRAVTIAKGKRKPTPAQKRAFYGQGVS